MRFNRLFIIIAITGLSLSSCKKKGCKDATATNYSVEAEKDDGSCEYLQDANLTLNFTQNIAGAAITETDFDMLNYTNSDGNVWSITKMQYMISNVRFYRANGDSVVVEGYHLIDMEDETSLTYALPATIPADPYVGIGFYFGFIPEDNISGQYEDLNVASWNSPEMLGGGYHQMKFEGRFIEDGGDTSSFQYHSLSEIREITTGNDTIFHNNYANIRLDQSMDINTNATIEIRMDVNEWFQNPYTWDLDTYSSMLMPNYDAQILMTQNVSTVFSVGTITE